jgi:hypothetical protein
LGFVRALNWGDAGTFVSGFGGSTLGVVTGLTSVIGGDWALRLALGKTKRRLAGGLA